MKVTICYNIEALLLEMFDADKELLEKWHIESPCTLDVAVDRTLKDMKSCDDLTIYSLKDKEGNLIGYFGHERHEEFNYLTGFGIKPEFRTDEIKEEFFKIINEVMGDNYYVGLYEKNTPARKFIAKNGGDVHIIMQDKEKKSVMFYKFNKSAKCQLQQP